ncbi:MAG: type II toxin-antitoxin system VapC family toxin [Staphylothermus sp.]|nr:type II toxin-antitoxin system VapC family toxin [Staphylothermus sp.]
MIVIDASVLIDALFSRNPERFVKAVNLLKHVEGMPLYAPRVIEVELIAVARRLGYKTEREKLLQLTRKFNLLREEEIFNLALYVADRIHPRAIDAYYIATAILTNSIIIANDRTLVNNSKQAGIEAFYLIEEYNTVINKVKELKKHREP